MIEIIPRFVLWFIIVLIFVFKDLELNRLRYDDVIFSPITPAFLFFGRFLKVPDKYFKSAWLYELKKWFKIPLFKFQGAMMSIAFKEGLKIPPPAMNEIILGANQDIRQVN